MEYFAIAMVLLFIAAILFSIFYKGGVATCPNGHSKEVRQIGREPLRSHNFQSSGSGSESGGYTNTRVQYAVKFHCGTCGEVWTEGRAQ